MPANLQFKKSALCMSIHSILGKANRTQLCLSLVLGMLAQQAFAQTENLSDLQESQENTIHQTNEYFDSYQMLQDQIRAGASLSEFQPIELKEDDEQKLENLPEIAVDHKMVNEILEVATQAKTDAEKYRAEQSKAIVVNDATQQELLDLNQAPINVDQLMRRIENDQDISVAINESGRTLSASTVATEIEPQKQPGFFTRLYQRIRPSVLLQQTAIKRINANVEIVDGSTDGFTLKEKIAVQALKDNVEAKLSSYTVEAFEDFISARAQLRTYSVEAAQAVGFYNAEFKFERISDGQVRVLVTPNKPVLVKSNDIEFTGAGQNQAQFQVISILPELAEGDVFNHGKYDKTKLRIVDAANNNGYFDAYWRLHDVKIEQPQDTAAINLKYETGDRYKLGGVEFRMSDPDKPFPIDLDVLEKLVPWQAGQDYAFWRVNGLANNLTNSRYFNYTLVDAVKPDPIEKTLEYAPDIQALIDMDNLANGRDPNTGLSTGQALVEDSTLMNQKNLVNENQFAGMGLSSKEERSLLNDEKTQEEKNNETDRLKALAREQKEIPVIVTLNADKLNNAEVGLGYGTDTGVRLRSQYRRSIVNRRGHTFDANFELSQIRQSVDGRYNIPYNHPLNDYISFVGGYERETRKDVSDNANLLIESAVLGADRIIKKPRGSWQHIIGVRYRLDRLTGEGSYNIDDIPDSFLGTGNREQESLLFGYEISRLDSDKRVNPTKGFKQTYKIEAGAEKLMTDVDMAMVNADWRFIYSLGENANHQFVGRANVGYIFADDFSKVPYNLRYITGGDQSIRGFDYKSLSPKEDGFKVGGQALAIGSLEYNYQFTEGWRAAIFSDFGNAYDKDFKTPTAYGAGVGIRWASPIGPIRLDVASGLSDEGHPIRLHFFIGSQL